MGEVDEEVGRTRTLIAGYNSNEMLIIRDAESVKRKIKRFHNEGGLDNLCILSDFDYTLTRYSLNGKKKLDSSFACISNVRFKRDYYFYSNHLRNLTSEKESEFYL